MREEAAERDGTMYKHDCPFNHELLTAYASGNAAGSDERKIVERHLAQCACCRREVARLEQIWWALDVWEEKETRVPLRLEGFRQRVSAAKRSEPWWSGAWNRVRGAFEPMRLAPAAAAALALGVLFSIPVAQTLYPGAPVSQPAVADSEAEDAAGREQRFEKALYAGRAEAERRNAAAARPLYTGYTPNRDIIPSIEADANVNLSPSYAFAASRPRVVTR